MDSVIKKEATQKDIDTISDVCNTMNGKTICVFAPAVADIIGSIIKKFPQEFTAYLKKEPSDNETNKNKIPQKKRVIV